MFIAFSLKPVVEFQQGSALGYLHHEISVGYLCLVSIVFVGGSLGIADVQAVLGLVAVVGFVASYPLVDAVVGKKPLAAFLFKVQFERDFGLGLHTHCPNAQQERA